MDEFGTAFAHAFRLLAGFDDELYGNVALSLEVNLAAVVLAAALGVPLGGVLAVYRFAGRRACAVLLNAMMGLPPVVVGLVVYLMLSRSGPFSVLDLLFTPGAMIVAQTILVTPIVAALTRQILESEWSAYRDQLTSLGCGPGRAIPTLVWEAREAVLTTLLAGFGRAAAEVGAVIIVGGNIAHYTRVMTTSIALETGRGNLALALGLGIVLLLLSLVINGLAWALRETREEAVAWRAP